MGVCLLTKASKLKIELVYGPTHVAKSGGTTTAINYNIKTGIAIGVNCSGNVNGMQTVGLTTSSGSLTQYFAPFKYGDGGAGGSLGIWRVNNFVSGGTFTISGYYFDYLTVFRISN